MLMIDHLVFATPDLERGVSEIEALTGVCASPGGRHPAWGTHNCLAALGAETYLEIIAPDPAQPEPAAPRPFGLDGLPGSRLASWGVRGDHLERLVRAAAGNGVRLGELLSGSRIRSDGVVLAWELTSPPTSIEAGLIPFFIDWGSSPHPAGSAASGLSLVGLRAEHPEPAGVARSLAALGADLPVLRASEPALVAVLDSPRGRVELR